MPSNPTSAPRPPAGRRLRRLAAAALAAAAAALAHAAPFVPESEDSVVQTLRPSLGGPDAAERRARRAAQAALQARPQDLPLALRLAREAIDEARASGDPRALGQARAALAPWWEQPAPPAPARLLRAIVLQSEHAFGAALADLAALVSDPDAPLPVRAQALLTQASVWQVQGRYAQAAQACRELGGPRFRALGEAVALPARACEAELLSLTGEPARARALLAALAREAGPAHAAWLALVRAELAERQADAGAEALYRQSLAAGAGVYELGAFADWLLDRGRPAEVLRLLEGRDGADALLLRRAEALQALGDPRAADAVRELAARFDALRLRGDATHRREEARLALRLQRDPPRALALAQANWAVQREPADARLLLEAAAAAGRPQAAQPVHDFLRETGLVDRRLPVSGRLEASR
ncbi:hypothetical protein [Caldimonas tepidiphila]|uniref:hypothetical protein n=1 Tax=Caldimonas tepidiphila TaxID=2315841 RepID=UPI000E5A13B6|nr:hypothetical protein [Caldimonas tepidiphila]